MVDFRSGHQEINLVAMRKMDKCTFGVYIYILFILSAQYYIGLIY
jgi:hypothetical protein